MADFLSPIHAQVKHIKGTAGPMAVVDIGAVTAETKKRVTVTMPPFRIAKVVATKVAFQLKTDNGGEQDFVGY